MNTNRFAYLAALLANRAELPHHEVAQDTTELVGHARALQRLAVKSCNEGLSDRELNRDAVLTGKVERIARKYGLEAVTGNDPRGNVVRLVDPKDYGAGDSMAGGWGVY